MSATGKSRRWWLLGLLLTGTVVVAALVFALISGQEPHESSPPEAEDFEPPGVEHRGLDGRDMGDRRFPWYIGRLGYRALWRHTKGAKVRIAVLDSGVADDVPGLATAELSMFDAAGTPLDFEDERDHGTPVVSLILSTDQSAPGVAVEAEVAVYVVYDGTGEPISHLVASAMEHALSDSRTDIILCSFGLSDQDDDVAAQVQAAQSAQVPIIVASGNEANVRYTFPEDFPSVLIVGGSERDDRPLRGSRYGEWTQVFAPGRDLAVFKADGEVQRNEYGTSGAAAIVAGTLAMGLSASVELGEPLEGGRPAHRSAVVEALLRTARDERRSTAVISPIEFLQTLVPDVEIEP